MEWDVTKEDGRRLALYVLHLKDPRRRFDPSLLLSLTPGGGCI